MLPSHYLPRQTGKSAFQRPQQVETRVGICLFYTGIGDDGTDMTKLRDGSDASTRKHVLRLGAKIGKP